MMCMKLTVFLLFCVAVTASNVDNSGDAANVAELTARLQTAESVLNDLKSLVDRQQHIIDALVIGNGEHVKQRGSEASNNASDSNEKTSTLAGVTYIRWGRTVCSGTAEAFGIYKGYAARGHSSDIGAGVNTLCLHEEPVWGNYDDNVADGNSAFVYGTEYAFVDVPFSTINNAGTSLSSNDVPCIACFAPYQSVQIMIPARSACPTYGNWTLEYRGYLVNNFHADIQSDYVCLDEAPEGIPGGINTVTSAHIASNVRPAALSTVRRRQTSTVCRVHTLTNDPGLSTSATEETKWDFNQVKLNILMSSTGHMTLA